MDYLSVGFSCRSKNVVKTPCRGTWVVWSGEPLAQVMISVMMESASPSPSVSPRCSSSQSQINKKSKQNQTKPTPCELQL